MELTKLKQPANQETRKKRKHLNKTRGKKMITYFSPSCGLFLELFFCLPQRFLKPSRIVFPLFQHLLLILLKLRNLFDNAISKKRKRKFPLKVRQRWDLYKVPNSLLGTLRSDEGEGNKNIKKVKQQLCKCMRTLFLHFFSLTARP